jgi:hypothetical protein
MSIFPIAFVFDEDSRLLGKVTFRKCNEVITFFIVIITRVLGLEPWPSFMLGLKL